MIKIFYSLKNIQIVYYDSPYFRKYNIRCITIIRVKMYKQTSHCWYMWWISYDTIHRLYKDLVIYDLLVLFIKEVNQFPK